MRHVYVRVTLLLALFNSFLTSRVLPEGVFTAKELGLYAAAVLSVLLTTVSLLTYNTTKIRFCRRDALTLILLIVLPWIQWGTHITSSTAYVLQYSSYGLIYLSVRVLVSGTDTSLIFNAVRESFKVTILFTLLLSVLQEEGRLVSMSPSLGVTAMFYNPGPYAIYLSALLCGYIPFMIYSLQKNKRNILGIAFDLMLVFGALFFIISSFSRSAWIGCLGSFLAIAIVWLGATLRILLEKNKWAFISLCLVALGVAILAYKKKESSTTGRILIWNSSIALFNDHKVSGVGIGMFSGKYIDYQAATLDRYQEVKNTTYHHLAGDVRFAFNDVIQISGELGVVGLILFITIVIGATYPIIGVARSNHKHTVRMTLALSAFSIVLCILFAGITSYPLQMKPISVLFWLAMAILVGIGPGSNPRSGSIYQSRILHGIILLSIGTIVGYKGYLRFSAYREWALQKELLNLSSDSLYKLYPVLADHSGYLFDLANVSRSEENYESSTKFIREAIRLNPYPGYYYFLGQNLVQLGDYRGALACYTSIERAIPGLYKPRYLKALLYEATGDTTRFYEYSRSVLTFDPKIENAETKQMRADLQLRLLRYKKE